MREGFSIVMKGSEIKTHVESFVPLFEEQARKIESQITEARAEAHKNVDKRFDEEVAGPPYHQPISPIDGMVAHRKSLLDLARKHHALAEHIEPDESFRLSREDIMFLGLIGSDGRMSLRGGLGG